MKIEIELPEGFGKILTDLGYKDSWETIVQKFIYTIASIPILALSQQEKMNAISIRSKTRVHPIPEGYVTIAEFCKERYGYPTFISMALKSDGDLRPFRKRIGRFFYIEAEEVHKFFDSKKGRERYPQMRRKVDAYNQRRKDHVPTRNDA